jgi:hypothetical protein
LGEQPDKESKNMNLSKIIKQTSIGWLVNAILLFAAAAIFNLSAPAQTVKRVAFIYGKANVIYTDAAKIGEKDTYVIKLKKGQSFQVDVEWQGEDAADEGQGLSGFTIVYPNGKKLVDAQDGYVQADTAGDYKIVVSPKTKKTNYRYRIVFTQI